MTRGQKIPGTMQLKTGKYSLYIGDDTVTVNVTSDESIIDHFIEKFVAQLAADREKKLNSEPTLRKKPDTKYIEPTRFPPIPVGIDCRFRYRVVKSLSRYVILSLPKDNNQFLVAHIRGKKLPSSVKKFLEDQFFDYICLIGEREPHKVCFDLPENTGIRAGELVARVYKEEELYSCKDLEKVAERAGVDYDKSVADGGVVSSTCSRYWEGQIFTEDEIRSLVYKAYICRKIGEKLMKKLVNL